jgi:phage host-nuclease inhibitor protein Gam
MKKKITTTLTSFDEVDAALLKLGQHESFVQHEEAVMNDLMQKARDAFDQATSTSRNNADALRNDIESFCVLNKTEFEKLRSKELTHGTVGFRKSPPSLSLLNRKYNWKTVVELLRRLRLKQFVRNKPEVDKEGLLVEYAANKLSDDRLAACGLKVDQSDEFNLDIKWDSITGSTSK